MLVKCICSNCAGHLEFEEENAGSKIPCPHCGFETTLTLPGSESQDMELVDLARRIVRRRRLLRIGLSVVGAAGLGFAAYRWALPWVENTVSFADTTPKAVLTLVAGVVAIPFALCWLALPMLLWLQLGRMNKLLEEISNQLPSAPAEEPPAPPEELPQAPEEAQDA